MEKLNIQSKIDIMNKTIPLEIRIQAKKDSLNEALNPIPEQDFDPDNFEPLASQDEKELCYRQRVVPPQELPTFGIKPKEIMDGQMIGMYESKQDLYLTFAHRCNDLQKQIDELTEELNEKVELLEKKLK